MMWHIYLAAVICGAVLLGIAMIGGMLLLGQWMSLEATRRRNQATITTRDIRHDFSGGREGPYGIIPTEEIR